jgi:hypothetical protein
LDRIIGGGLGRRGFGRLRGEGGGEKDQGPRAKDQGKQREAERHGRGTRGWRQNCDGGHADAQSGWVRRHGERGRTGGGGGGRQGNHGSGDPCHEGGRETDAGEAASPKVSASRDARATQTRGGGSGTGSVRDGGTLASVTGQSADGERKKGRAETWSARTIF